MQLSTVTIHSIPRDVLSNHIWELARRPATMAVVCEAWQKISEAWFDKANREIIKENPVLLECYEKAKSTRSSVVLFRQLVRALLHTENYLLQAEKPRAKLNMGFCGATPQLRLDCTDGVTLDIPKFKQITSKINPCLASYETHYQFVIDKITEKLLNTPNLDPTFQTKAIEFIVSTNRPGRNKKERLLEVRKFICNIWGMISTADNVFLAKLVQLRLVAFINIQSVLNDFWSTEANDFPYKLREMLPLTNPSRN